jgi:hypothetical protein
VGQLFELQRLRVLADKTDLEVVDGITSPGRDRSGAVDLLGRVRGPPPPAAWPLTPRRPCFSSANRPDLDAALGYAVPFCEAPGNWWPGRAVGSATLR